ncbi:MAG: hypothetical protein ACI9VO_001626, partial [Colwellia sp.]
LNKTKRIITSHYNNKNKAYQYKLYLPINYRAK